MSIIEVILVVSAVLHVFSVIFIILTFMMAANAKTQLQQLHAGMITALGKLFTAEQLLQKINNGFAEFIRLTDSMLDQSPNTFFKTGDGKYTARTFDELIEKINDSESVNNYFSEEELEKLRNLFNADDDSDDEDDDN